MDELYWTVSEGIPGIIWHSPGGALVIFIDETWTIEQDEGMVLNIKDLVGRLKPPLIVLPNILG